MYYLREWGNKDREKSNTAVHVMLYGKCTQSICDLTQLTQASFLVDTTRRKVLVIKYISHFFALSPVQFR